VAIFLGIDGGGSKTSCLIGDESSVLGTGTAGPSNLIRAGEAQARKSLAAAIRQACTVANLKPAEISRVCVGLAGAARPEISEVVRGIIAEIISGEARAGQIKTSDIQVVGDNVIALEAAFGAGPGVIVIAGTGSIAYGRNRDGQTARAGGWGFAVSDEGSGHWIGRAAVAAALRAWDESQDEKAPLLLSVMKSWGLENRESLVLAANATPAPDFAALFPAVLALADSGDRGASEVLAQAGSQLAELAGIVVRRLFPDSGAVAAAMSGGVFGSSALVRQVFYNGLRSVHPDIALNPGVIEPVRGALEMARQGAAK
jgi:N-acetylglucosamine kinase-like BadF-type ATPase